jgi:hypothetical protein
MTARHNVRTPGPAWLGWLATALSLALVAGVATGARRLTLAASVALVPVVLWVLVLGLRR